jgi:hypothetical protein
MHFCGLRVVCPICHATFLVGGCARNDLTRWRASVVACRHCGADTSAANGQVVDLGAQTADEGVESAAGELCHA